MVVLIYSNQRQKEQYTTLIGEKDEQIAQLLAEGMSLYFNITKPMI